MSLVKSLAWPLLFYFIGLTLFTLWSFSLTDPNLVYTTWPPYWQWQNWMWQTFFVQPTRLWVSFLILLVWLWSAYSWILIRVWRGESIKKNTSLKWSQLLLMMVVALLPLLFANVALSHDLFNYVFNAKMVMVYQADPHIQTALDFAQDPWVRFMHNTHTPAPYWYGWTTLSLLPYVVGMGKFLLTYLSFKVFAAVSVISMVGAYWLYERWSGMRVSRLWAVVVLLSPLVLLELIATGHNDWWMMLPAVLSIGLLLRRRVTMTSVGFSALLLLFSMSIKYATAVLMPAWLVSVTFLLLMNSTLARWKILKGVTTWAQRWWKHWAYLLPFVCALSMSLLLMTERSKRFLPWYLVWLLVWLPLVSLPKRWQYSHARGELFLYHAFFWFSSLVMGFSLSALLRYLPWLAQGEFTPSVIGQQIYILWLGGILLGMVIGIVRKRLAAQSVA